MYLYRHLAHVVKLDKTILTLQKVAKTGWPRNVCRDRLVIYHYKINAFDICVLCFHLQDFDHAHALGKYNLLVSIRCLHRSRLLATWCTQLDKVMRETSGCTSFTAYAETGLSNSRANLHMFAIFSSKFALKMPAHSMKTISRPVKI